jgi:hypothetical protein
VFKKIIAVFTAILKNFLQFCSRYLKTAILNIKYKLNALKKSYRSRKGAGQDSAIFVEDNNRNGFRCSAP